MPGAAVISVSWPLRMKTSLLFRTSNGLYRGVPLPVFFRRPWLRLKMAPPFYVKVSMMFTNSDHSPRWPQREHWISRPIWPLIVTYAAQTAQHG